MPRRCGLGCTPTRGVLHVFPNPDKFPEQFKSWVRVVCGQEECNFDYKNMRICDRHFTEKDRNRYSRLNALAVPSLFLRGQSSNRDLSNSTSEQTLNQPEVSDNYHQSSSLSSGQIDEQAMENSSLDIPEVLDIQQSTSETEEVKSLYLTSRCCTCLSLARNLKPLKPQDNIILRMLCPEMFLHAKHYNHYRYFICWECEHMIIKIKRFQTRVSKAQAQLKLTLQGVHSIVDGLSNMKSTVIETIDIPPQALQVISTEQNQQMLIDIPQPVSPPPIKITTLNVDLETIKIDVEEEEKCFSSDYDELIPPTKIQLASRKESTDAASESEIHEDPLKTPQEKTPIIKTKCGTVGVPPQKATKHGIIAPNVQYRPQKVFIKAPKTNIAPRGYREEVKVTGGVPNLVTGESVPILVKTKACVPTMVKTSEGFSIVVKDNDGASIVANHTGNVSNLVKGKVAPDVSKPEEPTLKRLIIPIDVNSTKEPPCRKPECQQREGIYGFEEDELKCTILNETELNRYRDKKRSTIGYKGHPYKCDRCIQKFSFKKHLDQHNLKHDESRGPSMCKVCEQRFPRKSVRNEHYKKHFIVYDCPKCQYQNNDRMKTSEHFRRVHKVSVFHCKKCDAVFKTFREKKKHRLTVHSTNKKSSCEECGKTFPSFTLLKVHMLIHQRETKDCPVCKKKVRMNYFDKHMKIHDDARVDSAYCVVCGIIFKSEKSYALHLKNSLIHNTVDKIGIKCDHCNKYFLKKSALKDHLEEVNGIKYTCDICKKDLKNKSSLASHIRIKHMGKKPQPKPKICEFCGKTFYCKQGLTEHINGHLGLRPHVCKDCGATFSYSGALYTHRRLVHKVKRRYEMPT